MIRRLIILLLIVGCDYAPTEHTHDGHYSCTFHLIGYLTLEPPVNQLVDSLTSSVDTISVIHASNLDEAFLYCRGIYSSFYNNTYVDSSWCDCNEGIYAN